MEITQVNLENNARMLARRLSLYWACVVVFYFLYLYVSDMVSPYYQFNFFADTYGFAVRLLFVAAITWLPRKFELVGGILNLLFGLYWGWFTYGFMMFGLPLGESIMFLLVGSIPTLVIGVLFMVSWIKTRKTKPLAESNDKVGNEVKPENHAMARMNKLVALYGLILIVVLVLTSPSVHKLFLELDLVGAYRRGEDVDNFQWLEVVTVQGDYAYASAFYPKANDWKSAIHIFDISEPADPVKVGSYISEGHIVDFEISGEYAYLSSRDIGLEILDISDPTHPTQINEFFAGYTESLVVQDNLVFLYEYKGMEEQGYEKGRLYVLDVSDPTNIKQVGVMADIGSPMAIYDHFLYTVRSSDSFNDADELFLVDVANLQNPVPILQDLSIRYIRDMEISEGILYISANDAHIVLFDISDPTVPVELGSYNVVIPRSLAVAGSYLYIANLDGITVLNVSDPGKPRLAARNVLDVPSSVFVYNGYVFLADITGLFIFETKK